MIWVFAILFASYFTIMAILVRGFKRIKTFKVEEHTAKIGFSIIIPFRNEAENLQNLLPTIELLNYPTDLFEVIFVNDASEDISETIVYKALEKSKVSIRLLQNNRISGSPKKDAISVAIKTSKFEWIVTTDADCELPENWLRSLDAFIQKENPIMVCGPVIYNSNGSLVDNYQQMDCLSLQAVTIGSFGLNNPLLNNGANLAYSKNAFFKVKGFEGNSHIASGDDIFLLEKMKKAFPKQIRFLKSETAIVLTKPQKTWKDVINQRVRWASKISKQKNGTSILIGALVFIVNISFLFILVLILLRHENTIIYTFFLVFKIVVDYLIIRQVATFFNVKISTYKFPLQILIYSIITLIVVFGSFFGKYTWKGRQFQK